MRSRVLETSQTVSVRTLALGIGLASLIAFPAKAADAQFNDLERFSHGNWKTSYVQAVPDAGLEYRFCSMSASFKEVGIEYTVDLIFGIGNHETLYINLLKDSWRLPIDVDVNVAFKMGGWRNEEITGDNEPWLFVGKTLTEQGIQLEIGSDRAAWDRFDREFRNETAIQFYFVDGDEGTWTYSLEGSAANMLKFKECMLASKAWLANQQRHNTTPLAPKATSPLAKKEPTSPIAPQPSKVDVQPALGDLL